MQVFLFILVGYLTVIACGAKDENTRINGVNGWYVPLVNGSFDWVDKEKAESYCKTMGSTFKTSNPVYFTLYTNLNPDNGEEISPSSTDIENSNFNPAYPTRIVIHGWNLYMDGAIRNAWFRVGKYNVIYVKWPRGKSIFYSNSVEAVPDVGKQVANLIDSLVTNHQMSLRKLIVIGFGLGAHVAGFAGKNVKTGQINTIIALDAALSLFSIDKPAERLNTGDAYYVESIHTNAGNLGFEEPIGKAAFYPNGGKSQPGCTFDIMGLCAHLRAVTYYVEAIVKNNYGTVACKNYKDALAKKCGDKLSSVRMGAVINANVANGSYYVPVEYPAPFGILPY